MITPLPTRDGLAGGLAALAARFARNVCRYLNRVEAVTGGKRSLAFLIFQYVGGVIEILGHSSKYCSVLIA